MISRNNSIAQNLLYLGRHLSEVDFTDISELTTRESDLLATVMQPLFQQALKALLVTCGLPIPVVVKIIKLIGTNELVWFNTVNSRSVLAGYLDNKVTDYAALIALKQAIDTLSPLDMLIKIFVANAYDSNMNATAAYLANAWGQSCNKRVSYSDLSNENLQNNAACFFNNLRAEASQIAFLLDPKRLQAAQVFIDHLSFDTKDAVEVIFHYLTDKAYEEFNVLPVQQLSLLSNLMIDLMEKHPGLNGLTIKEVLNAVFFNVSDLYQIATAEISVYLRANNISRLHVLALEPNKLNAVQNLIHNFTYGIREAFEQTAQMTVAEIKGVNLTPMHAVMTAKNITGNLMRSAPAYACDTIEEAISARLTFNEARAEIQNIINMNDERYVGSYKKRVDDANMQHFHVAKMLSRAVEQQFLNDLSHAPSPDLNVTYNRDTIKFVRDHQDVWNNITAVLKFNCIEARTLIFKFNEVKMQEYCVLANTAMQRILQLLPFQMLADDFLALTETEKLKRVIAKTFTQANIPELRGWDLNDLLSPAAIRNALLFIQNLKEENSVRYHLFLARQKEFNSLTGIDIIPTNITINATTNAVISDYLRQQYDLLHHHDDYRTQSNDSDFLNTQQMLLMLMVMMMATLLIYRLNPLKKFKDFYRNNGLFGTKNNTTPDTVHVVHRTRRLGSRPASEV